MDGTIPAPAATGTASSDGSYSNNTASAKLYSLVETAEANQLEPHACLSLIFTRLPTLTKIEDYEVLLRWNARTGLASFTARPVERRNAIA